MRELSDKFKISARSLGEVAEAINTMVSRFRTTGDVTYLNKNLTREALINAVILYVDSLPHDAKVKAVGEGIAHLESLLRDDAATEPVTNPEPGGQVRTPPSVRGETDPRKRRRQSETG